MCISLKSHVIAPRSIVARLLADSLFCETQLLPLLREFCFSFPLLLQEKKKIQCHRGAHFISASVRKKLSFISSHKLHTGTEQDGTQHYCEKCGNETALYGIEVGGKGSLASKFCPTVMSWSCAGANRDTSCCQLLCHITSACIHTPNAAYTQ